MKNLYIAGAILVSAGVHAALPKALLSSVTGDPTNIIPGGAAWQLADLDPFDSLRLSPDRTKWAICGEQENGTSDLDIIVRGTVSPFAVTDLVAIEGGTVGASTDLWVTLRDSMSIANDGTVYFAGDTNAATTIDDVVASWNGTLTILAREGDSVPTLTDINFGSGNNSIHVTNDGRIRWISTGLTGAGTLTGQTQLIYQVQSGVSTILARSGITVPTGQLVAPDQTIQSFTTDRLQSAAETGETFYNVTLTGPTTSNVAMLANNGVVVQETATFTGFSTGVTSLSSSDAHTITANGNFKLSRASLLTSGLDLCILNGQVIAATDAPIAPGSSELWDDAIFGTTFFQSTCNGYGEYMIGGVTNSANVNANAVLIFTAAGRSYEILREGDPVDMNGNGIADDGVTLSIFDDNTMTVTDGNMAYMVVEVVDGAAVYQGDVVVEIKLPLTGDVDNSGEVDAADIDLVIAQFGSTTPGIPEDVDGSGEVDAADIDIVIANFGRTR